MNLTLPQQDIYFEQLLYPTDPIYNIGAKIEIKGIINVEVFKKAYIALINQHDAYRSIIKTDKESAYIDLLEEHQSELGYIDFSDSENAIEESNIYMQKEFIKPFDFFSGNLLHIFTLIKVKEDYYYLFSVYHHIITDGWGTSLMFQRLVQNYNEILEFGEVTSEYSFTYKDFAEDDYKYHKSTSYAEDLAYWKQKFKVLPERIMDTLNHNVHLNKSSRKALIIKRAVYNQLNTLALAYKCSTFHLILGILYTYFGRKHQCTDLAIGLPVLNRSKARYKKTVGLFMGVSPLRITLDFEATFQDLITDIKNQLRQDYRHQRIPLGKIIQELKLYDQKERLFNITLSYEKQDYAHHFKNTKTRVIPLSHQSERVGLALYIREFDENEDVKIDFDYNLNYFNDSSIVKLINHFEQLISEVLTGADKKLRALSYLTLTESKQLLIDFNTTKAVYPKSKTILEVFQEQVKNRPEHIALKDDLKSYSYAQLDLLSSRIASFIITKFGKEDTSPIALLLGRSAHLIAVLLGVLKTKRSYIPLDPAFPAERLSHIIDNSQVKIIINENNHIIQKVKNITTIALESILDAIDQCKVTELERVSPQDTAYIIYTSGSTGYPKGVEIGHRSLLNFLTSMQEKPGITKEDTLFSVTTYSFDISILEFFLPLISGATLYVADQNVLSTPDLIIKKIKEVKPTIMQATPSFYQMLFNADWLGDKKIKILCGGDVLSESLAEKLIDNSLELWNMYGPTETTIWSSTKKIEQPSFSSTIGKPINNTAFYILDNFLQPKPIGTPGNIYIAGEGLAKGYYKNEKLTGERFIQNPFDKNNLLYDTGDVGQWNDIGEIEFLGRNDNQVKIRGYRIELGDIESRLHQIPGIRDSVVIAKKREEHDVFLVAYILKNPEFTDKKNVVNQLKTSLPDYMIPNTIITLEEFPLTPNKKVDRKELSQREIQYHTYGTNFNEPVSDLEKKLSEFWKEVLTTKESISISDNFFTLGGHSLNAVKLAALISKDLSLDITLKTIFEYPSIASLAKYLNRLKPTKSNAIPLSQTKDLYHLTPSQYTIWLASQQTRNSIAYNMSAVYEVQGIINIAKLNVSIHQIIEKYEILRTNFTEIGGRPYQKINSFDRIRFEISVSRPEKNSVEETIALFVNSEFDLEKELLIRVQVLELSMDQHLFLFSTHHIIMDGLSLEIFIKECIQNYNENTQNSTKENTLKFQFKDYAEWLNQSIEEQASTSTFFWKNYLRNYTAKNSFETDFNGESNTQKQGELSFELTEEVTGSLKKLATEQQTTLYTILVASIKVLIFKMSKHTDICIGTVNSGRNNADLENQIGMFVKTVVLRSQIESEQTFIDLLTKIHDNILEVNSYLDLPFDKVPSAIFDVMLVYQNPEFSFENINELSALKLTYRPVNNKYSRMPFVFNLFESEQTLKGIINYSSDLYEEDTVYDISSKFIKILEEIVSKPLAQLEDIHDQLAQEVSADFDFDF